MAVAPALRRQFGQCRRHDLGALLPLLQELAFRREPLLLAVFGCQRAKFGGGVAQELLVAQGGRDPLPCCAKRLLPLAPNTMQRRHPGAQSGIDAERIQQRQMPGRVGEAHLVVLALHLDQQRAEPTQQPGAHWRIVGEGARAAIAAEHAPQRDVVLAGNAMFAQQRVGGMVQCRREHRDHRGLFRTLAHQSLLGARAECQAQAVQQDRLARAGLAGEDGEAGVELQIQALDQHHVADRQAGQHGAVSLLAALVLQKSEPKVRAIRPCFGPVLGSGTREPLICLSATSWFQLSSYQTLPG